MSACPDRLGREGSLDRAVHHAGAVLDIGEHAGGAVAFRDLLELREEPGIALEIKELLQHHSSLLA